MNKGSSRPKLMENMEELISVLHGLLHPKIVCLKVACILKLQHYVVQIFLFTSYELIKWLLTFCVQFPI